MDKRTLNLLSVTALLLVSFLLVYFFYTGVTTQAWEGDSLAYHIPIAKDILSGAFLHPPRSGVGLRYYPGASEALLAIFIAIGLPLNLYNVLGWGVLFYLCYRLAQRFGLERASGLLFAASIVSLPSVIRLIPTQTIDIWLAVFFTWSLYLLKKPEKTKSYFVLLGIAVGMLVGTKYSGLLFAAGLFFFSIKSLLPILSLKRIGLFCLPFLLLGGFWYIRNAYLTGNPFYPGHFLFLSGNPHFLLQNWQPWKTILLRPQGLYQLLMAINSEFLLWGGVIILEFFYLLFFLNHKDKADMLIGKLFLLGCVNFIIYLFLPSWPQNLISDLRYIYPAVIPFILSVFLIARKHTYLDVLGIFSLLNIAFVFPQLDYYPKLVLVFGVLVVLLYIAQKVIRKYTVL